MRNGAVAAVAVGVIAAVAIGWAARARSDRVQCGAGFVVQGARCAVPPGACPAPLAMTPRGCDAPRVRIAIPGGDLQIGPGDWEAEGRVAPRTLHVAAFQIDAFEVTVGALDPQATTDLARAASGVTRDAAARFCASRGGRLPTRDEWIAAAGPRRYPWGDTGAVCRRAAWGLAAGPCATGAAGPDTVGAHPEGDSPTGLHDMAGNVAEWVEGEPPAVRGGAWDSSLATSLRTWAEEPADPGKGDARVGFRCAYSPSPPQ